MSYRWWGH